MRKYLPNLPAFILAIGAILRIAETGASAIWFDETATLYRSTLPFFSLWVSRVDASGAILLDLILRPLLALSHSLWILRLPSLLASLVSLWLVWKLIQKLNFTRLQQVVSCTFISFLPGLLWISLDARSYSLLACLFLAALWFALDGRWLGLMALCGLSVYVHNVGPVFAVVALLIAWYLRPEQVRFVLVTALGAALAWIPAVIHMLMTWGVQQPWQPIVTFNWIYYSSMLVLWPVRWNVVIIFCAFFVLGFTVLYVGMVLLLHIYKRQNSNRLIPIAAWILPLVGLTLASLLTRNNFITYRTLAPALYPFALWLGYELGIQRWYTVLFTAAWILMLILGLYLWNPVDHGGGLDRVASQIRSAWRDGDVLVYTTATVALPFDYYLGDLPHVWDNTVQSAFLAAAIDHQDSVVAPVKHSTRRWIVIPREGLITPAEQLTLAEMVQNQQPRWTVNYVQAAPIDVFLVKAEEVSK